MDIGSKTWISAKILVNIGIWAKYQPNIGNIHIGIGKNIGIGKTNPTFA
jgi:hypothetical protein